MIMSMTSEYLQALAVSCRQYLCSEFVRALKGLIRPYWVVLLVNGLAERRKHRVN